MAEVIFGLAILAIVLGIVTLVGHGLWLLLATLFRGSAIQPPIDASIHPARSCPRCLSRLGKDADCTICNWPGELPPGPRREHVLHAFRRQLMHYSQLGLIDEVARKGLLSAFIETATVVDEAESQSSTAQDASARSAFTEVESPTAAEMSGAPVAVSLASNGEPDASSNEEVISAVAPTTPENRVRHYVANRRAAGVQPSQTPVIGAPPRPAFSKLFAAFLEEKNVRWGELAGGLLIVCCSIALVISFWSEIAARPLLKFCVFNGVSAALFGAGFYTERYWKIHTTSRGLLIIAILLVPLNFLAIAAFRTPALIAVAAGLIALILAALAAALLPGRDPLGLSERGRTVYVYAAEALLGLLFLHIRVTMPWLFRGWFLQFWPIVVMAIAFLGIGIAEWCRRRRQQVLSEPLENTGALLPMLPVLGYWILPSHINYSLVLLLVGALYSILSIFRRSFLFGMLATLAANGSLWYLLHSVDGLGLLQHPQLWLIPPAVCMLAAAYLNRSRLTPEQMTSIRYSAAVVIYASSTADVFVNGVGEAPWLPLVLAGLSLLGIFVGIWARVQAFLYLGLSFLLIALFTVIWYAAVELDRTWIWWVSGIVTGVLIMILFGLFEKKRDEILRLAERIRQWEA